MGKNLLFSKAYFLHVKQVRSTSKKHVIFYFLSFLLKKHFNNAEESRIGEIKRIEKTLNFILNALNKHKICQT